MNHLILIGLLVIIRNSVEGLTAQELSFRWNNFKGSYAKKYKNRFEEALRFQIYKTNLEFIEDHNARADKGEFTFWTKMNQFGDMTPKEFSQIANGFDRDLLFMRSQKAQLFSLNQTFFQLPLSIDWNKIVTPVKNQGTCGGCWAFSTTGAIEAQVAKKTGLLIPLSEQCLIDCARPFGNNGCRGGYMNNAYQYILSNGGISRAVSYPYRARDGVCNFKRNDPNNVKINGFVRIRRGSEDDLEQAVAVVGPVSVAMDSSLRTFQFYSNGVYFDPNCKNSFDGLNHALLAVGYGRSGNMEFWKIKNSWGSTWGENGYLRLIKRRENHCGVATEASYPLI